MKKTAAALLLCPLCAAAAREYFLYDNPYDAGSLVVDGNSFTLGIAGMRGHTCHLEGTAENGEYRDGEGCVVRFRFTGKDRAAVEIPPAAREACQTYSEPK